MASTVSLTHSGNPSICLTVDTFRDMHKWQIKGYVYATCLGCVCVCRKSCSCWHANDLFSWL